MPPLAEVARIVEAAGDAARSMQGSAGTRLKKDRSPVTDADQTSHQILVNGLQKFGIPIFSEEGAHTQTPDEHGLLWMVDPLDGTKDFVAGSADWCVMAGLLREDVPVLGVVYAPRYDKLWSAEKGRGAQLRERGASRSIHVSQTNDIREATAVVSVHHFSERERKYYARLGCSTRALGSIGLKWGSIAEGGADVYRSEAPLGEWDVCAPQAVLEEAGGRVSDLHGASLHYGAPSRRFAEGCVASNGVLHSLLTQPRL